MGQSVGWALLTVRVLSWAEPKAVLRGWILMGRAKAQAVLTGLFQMGRMLQVLNVLKPRMWERNLG